MEGEAGKRDFGELRMQELINRLYELKYKLMYELATAGMAEELESWICRAGMDVEAVTEELVEHIDVLADMKAVCVEMLYRVSSSSSEPSGSSESSEPSGPSGSSGNRSGLDVDGRTDRASLQRATRGVVNVENRG